MSNIKVLIHAIGSPLGQSILKSLKLSRLDIEIYVCDIYDDAAGLFMVPKEKRIILPIIKSSIYHETMIKIVKDYGIDFIFPVITQEHNYYENNKEYYKQNNVFVITMNDGVYDLVNNKLECFNFLDNAGISVPRTLAANLSEDFYRFIKYTSPPYLLKPINGISGKDIFILDNIDKIESIVAAYPQNHFLIQEYLSASDEYTVGVYRSPYSSFTDTMVIKRDLKFGLSYKGEVIENEVISNYALNVCQALSTVFSANVQLKLQDSLPFVFEVNPRLSSTTYIRAHFGFNEPEMIIRDILNRGENLNFTKRKGRFSRYWEEFFFENEVT